jgi:hypothetical protein
MRISIAVVRVLWGGCGGVAATAALAEREGGLVAHDCLIRRAFMKARV